MKQDQCGSNDTETQNVTDHRKDTKKLDLTFVFLGNNKLLGVKFVHVEGSSLAFSEKAARRRSEHCDACPL